MKQKIRIASRKSPLALTQSHFIKQQLQQLYPEMVIEILGLVTEGDKRLNMPLASMGGKGLFVKELEQALLDHHADFAVHSLKDMPATLPDKLILAVICEREDPRDVFISNRYVSFVNLPENAHIGTASLRRECQLKIHRPDLKVSTLRGNVQTRLDRLDADEFDGIILAAAGLKRLGLENRITEYFAVDYFIPAVGQGALGIECRQNDENLINLLQPLAHYPTQVCITAERAMNFHLQGGCQIPIAGYAQLNENAQLSLTALVGKPNGSQYLRTCSTAAIKDAEQLGKTVAQELLAAGADKILNEI